MPSSGILLFETDSAAGGGGTSSYVQTEFLDTALPASSNSGLTSTVSTNPLGEFFANSVLPRYMAKTLWIKDLQVIDDRTKWIGNKPTYKIIWSEDFPGVDGYTVGTPTLSGSVEQKTVFLPGPGDVIGLSGVVRQVQWLVKPAISATAVTAKHVLDAVDGASISFGQTVVNTVSQAGLNEVIYNGYASAKASYGLHDFRLQAVTPSQLRVYGVVVYFEVAGSGVDLPSGSIYLDKSIVNFNGTTLAFPTGISSFIGGVAGLFMGENGVLGITTTFVPNFTASCSGASGSNLLSVGIGFGGSFPAGTGIFIPAGATHYLGAVTSVSGDVLTVSPAFPFGISNTVHSIFQAGHTFSQVDGWTTAFDFVPSPNFLNTGTDFLGSINPSGIQRPIFQYVSNDQNFAIIGSTISLIPATSVSAASGQTFGLVPLTGTGGYLQVAGRMSALEVEIVCGQSAILGFTISIDSLATVSLTGAVEGPTTIRRRIFTNGGVGWHTVNFTGNGATQCMISRIVGLEPTCTNGPTLGKLAEIPIGMTLINRDAYGSSSTALGNVQRIYGPNFYGQGDWVAVTTPTGDFRYPGIGYLSTSTENDTIQFSYFGTRFAVMGNEGAGAGQVSITVDGAPISATLGAWLGTGLTLGFHTVVINNEDALSNPLDITTFDFYSPVMQLKSCLNFDQTPELNKKISFYQQAEEPTQARPGDIWESSASGLAYQRLFGQWTPLNNNNPVGFFSPASTKVIGNTAFVSVPYTTATYDPFNMLAGGTTFAVIIPQDGNYHFSFVGSFAANSGGTRSVRLLNVGVADYEIGGVTVNSASAPSFLTGDIILPNLKKGAVLMPTVAQNSSGNLTLNQTGQFVVARIGP